MLARNGEQIDLVPHASDSGSVLVGNILPALATTELLTGSGA